MVKVIKLVPTSVPSHRWPTTTTVEATPVVILNPRKGNVALAQLTNQSPRLARDSCTPPKLSSASTPEGSPSHHIRPSRLSSLAHHPVAHGLRPGSSHTRKEMDEVEADLANALVTVIGGTRLAVSSVKVLTHLSWFYQVAEEQVLIVFSEHRITYHVLLTDLLGDAPFTLLFHRGRDRHEPFSHCLGTRSS
jgi:hypothetical protein